MMEEVPLFKVATARTCPQCGKESMTMIVLTNKKKGKQQGRHMKCKECGVEYPIDSLFPKHPRPLAAGVHVNSCLRGLNKYI